MNKTFYALVIAAIFSITVAQAKKTEMAMEKDTKHIEHNIKDGMHKMDHGMKDGMHKTNRWLEKETRDIEEDFDEAMHDIDRSNFSNDHKKLLKSQAQSNKDLAIKHAKDVDAQLKKNWKEREKFRPEMKKGDKKDRKVCKEVDSIIK